MNKKLIQIIAVALLLSSGSVSTVFAGAGHDHGESQFSGGSANTSFTLEQSVIDNLDIKTATAELSPISQTVEMLAQVKLLPEKQAIITPRFTGKVEALYVKLGEQVKKGQNLLRIAPLSVGSGPVTLTAPISGVLSTQNAVAGQVVSPGDMVMEVSDRTSVLAKGITYEITGIGKIKAGLRATLHIDALPGQTFEGEIQRIDQSIDEENRTFSAYALIDNADGALIPHMQGQLVIQLSSGGVPVLSVPRKAVLGTVGQNFVYVRDGNYFERRNVTLGVKHDGHQEIISGVFPGEDVVIQGNYQLQYINADGGADQINDHGHAH